MRPAIQDLIPNHPQQKIADDGRDVRAALAGRRARELLERQSLSDRQHVREHDDGEVVEGDRGGALERRQAEVEETASEVVTPQDRCRGWPGLRPSWCTPTVASRTGLIRLTRVCVSTVASVGARRAWGLVCEGEEAAAAVSPLRAR